MRNMLSFLDEMSKKTFATKKEIQWSRKLKYWILSYWVKPTVGVLFLHGRGWNAPQEPYINKPLLIEVKFHQKYQPL
jgi:hypothetical protein